MRKRGTDIKEFAYHFLKISNQELDTDIQEIDVEVIDKFLNYSWPGNIRELKNVLKRAVLLEKNYSLGAANLPDEIRYPVETDSPPSMEDDHGIALRTVTEKKEKEMILRTLEQVKYNKSKAARILNIDRKTLYNKIKQFNIEV